MGRVRIPFGLSNLRPRNAPALIRIRTSTLPDACEPEPRRPPGFHGRPSRQPGAVEIGVLQKRGLCLLPGCFEHAKIGSEISYLKSVQTGLTSSKEVPRPAQVEIRLRQREPVALAHERVESRLRLGTKRFPVGHDETVCRAIRPTHSTAELMKLRQSEPVRVLDHHHGCLRDVYPHLHDGSGNEQANPPVPLFASVAWRASPPSTGMTHTWFFPLRLEENASHRPSEENAGPEADFSPRVNWRAPEPSAFTTQMWERYSDFSPSMTGTRVT